MATRHKLQLETRNLEYSRFIKDQVLTEVQLNEILDFFEDQHRLSRTCLIGTGIVCGLQVRRNPQQVLLSDGAAVTTDGDLLKMEDTEFSHFARYEVPEGARYQPFIYHEGEEEKTVELYQLLTEEQAEEITASEVHSISELDNVITNWYALLYLEYYLKEPENCTPVNCDSQGRRQVAQPRVLILSQSDMERIVQPDGEHKTGDDIYLKYHDAYESYFTFPVLKARRVILNSNNTIDSNTLAGAFFTAARQGGSPLANAIKDLYRAFRFVLDPGNNINIDQLTDLFEETLNNTHDALKAQYTYDYYKDALTAYNELRDVVFNLYMECCPNIHAFPKHIMLGEPITANGTTSGAFRHRFYPSPAVSGTSNHTDKASSMLLRLQHIIRNFNPKITDTIRITPSFDNDKTLEERAIPFYYANINTLSKSWNHKRTLSGREKLNLSFHASDYSPPVPDETLNPLEYDIDPYNFFRIEGHIGKEYNTVLRELDTKRKTGGVPIDVVALRLGDPKLSDLNTDDFKCHFEDLFTMLRAFQTEISCLLGDGSKFFSGFTPKPAYFHVNIHRFIPAPGQPPWIINPDILNNLHHNFNLSHLTHATGGVYSGKASDKDAIRNRIKTNPKTTSPGEKDKFVLQELNLNLNDNIREIIANTQPTDITHDICDRFLKPVFQIDRIIKETLDLHPDAFGNYYLMALEEPVSTVEQFMERARNFVAQDPDYMELDESMKNVVFEYPAQIIGHLNIIQKFVPGSVAEITPDLISNYRNFSKSFCRRLKVMRTRLEKYLRAGDYQTQGFESVYLGMVDRMERICCSNEKLEVIMREIERRKSEILKTLSFASYAERHPGLEHKAGTHRGGTFVIVYTHRQNNESNQQNLFGRGIRELERNYEMTDKNLRNKNLQNYRDIETFALYIINNDDTIDREEELATFFTFNQIQPGSAYAEHIVKTLNTRIIDISRILCKDITQPPSEVVVADFSLPYLCCSDAPPVAFIVEQEHEPDPDPGPDPDPEPDPDPDPVDLSINPTQFCNHDDNNYPFTVTPNDGIVKTQNPELMNTLSRDDNGTYYFTPYQTGTSHLGNPIKFTVNDQTVQLTVKVFLQPIAKIISHEIDIADGLVYLNLEAESNPGFDDSITYKWIFGPGITGEGRVLQISFKEAMFQDEIPVTLHVSHEICQAEDSIAIPIPQEEPVNSCKVIIQKFFKAKQTFLNQDSTAESVSSLNDPQIPEIYTQLKSLYQGALDWSNNPKPQLLLSIIQSADQLLRQIYQYVPETESNLAFRILEEFIRLLWMLMLNMVRCNPDIPDNIRSIITGSITFFSRLRPRLIKKFPQLNKNKDFENAVLDFVENMATQDPAFKKALGTLYKTIQLFK